MISMRTSLPALWRESRFFRFNLVVAVVGAAYLLLW